MAKQLAVAAWILAGLTLASASASASASHVEAGQVYRRGGFYPKRDANHRVRSLAYELEAAAQHLSHGIGRERGRYRGHYDSRDRSRLRRKLDRFERRTHQLTRRLQRSDWRDAKVYRDVQKLSEDLHEITRYLDYRSGAVSRVSYLVQELTSYYGSSRGGYRHVHRPYRSHRR